MHNLALGKCLAFPKMKWSKSVWLALMHHALFYRNTGLLVTLGLVSLAVWNEECGRDRELDQWMWH